MKYIIYLLAAMYIIWWLYVINIFFVGKNINIDDIKKSIVIIIPQDKVISNQNNPNWLFEKYKHSWLWLWFINNKWTITTVNHIVENNDIKYKIIYKWKKYNSEVFYRNKKTDIANLKIITNEKINFSSLNISKKINNKEFLYSFWLNIKKLEVIYNTWVLLNKNTELNEMNNLIEISNNLKPWYSWWAIINSKWKVIWINYAVSNEKQYWINLTKKE